MVLYIQCKRILTVVIYVVAFAFIAAGAATPNWSKITLNNTANVFQTTSSIWARLGPFRQCQPDPNNRNFDGTFNLICTTVTENDINNLCNAFDPNFGFNIFPFNGNMVQAQNLPPKFCMFVRVTRGFTALAALLTGVAMIVAILAVCCEGASLSYVAGLTGFIGGTFALIAFAVGFDAFVNQFPAGWNNNLNFLGAGATNNFTGMVDFSIGLMIIGWILSWIGAFVGCCFARSSDEDDERKRAYA